MGTVRGSLRSRQWIFEFHDAAMFLSSYTTGGLSGRAQLHGVAVGYVYVLTAQFRFRQSLVGLEGLA
jgi:hypothetical protein